MTKNEFQLLHDLSDETMSILEFIRDKFYSKITKIRKGTFYDQEILSLNQKYDARKKNMFPSKNKEDFRVSVTEWDIYYNK